MREQILITREDKTLLKRILLRLGDEYADREDLLLLAQEIDRAVEVEQKEMPADVVTLNSKARVMDLESGVATEYTLVMPGEADFDKGRISVLAPLGTALLGYRVGDEIEWEVPRGMRKIRIDAILYQPEADGAA